jgi:hypothetical protein
MYNEYLSATIKILVIVFVGIIIDKPELIGEWQAKRDIAYDSIWGEYVMDCDCTEAYIE